MIRSYELEVGDRRHPCRDMPGRRSIITYVDDMDVAAALVRIVADLLPWAARGVEVGVDWWNEVDVDDDVWTLQLSTRHGELIATLRPAEVYASDRRQLELEVW